VIIKVINAFLTVVYGIGAALIFYWVLNKLAEMLPGKWEERLKPYFFIGPAFAIISLYLIYPAVQTVIYSFANADSTRWVGLGNYRDLFGSSGFRSTLFNTLLWIVVVPTVTIAVGLVIAVLADRLRPRGEKFTKTVIFMPMAIGAVIAATMWRFVYATNPPGTPQVGVQNEVVTKLGFDPVNWLQLNTLHLNSLMLMLIQLWMQAGFAMVLLSAAIKAVPVETLEAARIDGANERQIFFRVVIPQIRPTIVTVFVTVLIGVMKIFDIVYVMTNGNFNTNVIALDFFNQLFSNGNSGYAAAIVVLLVIAIIPVMVYQVRNFRAEEAAR
jgi:alpha-glucoside transport system permease protein